MVQLKIQDFLVGQKKEKFKILVRTVHELWNACVCIWIGLHKESIFEINLYMWRKIINKLGDETEFL